MKKNRIKFYKFFLLLFFLFNFACEKVGNCNNTNPIFDKYDPNSNEYKTELIEKLKTLNHNNIHYYITGCSHDKESNMDLLSVRFEAENLCAHANLQVFEKDSEIFKIFETESFGYRGAEIKGLKIEFSQDSAKPDLIYRGMQEIID